MVCIRKEFNSQKINLGHHGNRFIVLGHQYGHINISKHHKKIQCFHSRGQHLCKFIVTKEMVCIRKEFNSQKINLGHHGNRFIVLGHQYGHINISKHHKKIQCFHSRGQHLCKFIVTKEMVCIRKEFNSQKINLGHHGNRFIVLGHQYGRSDVM